MNFTELKNLLFAGAASIGAGLLSLAGGWDSALLTLIIFMSVDLLTGLACALIFKKSPKTENGAGSSKAGFKGVAKKVGILLCVIVAVRLDTLMGAQDICRNGVILFFIGNEGLSVVENLGLMGVPLPAFVKNALELLKKKGEDTNQTGTQSKD